MKITLTTACLCVALHHALPAQSDTISARRNEISVSAGISQGARFDATASPSTYSGRGYAGTIGYDHALGEHGLLFGTTLGGALNHFSPAGAFTAAEERLTEGELCATLLRQFSQLRVGAAVSSAFALTAHQYADPSRRAATFFMAAATLGPAVEWTRTIRGGLTRLQLTSPLVGLVSHPYSDMRSESQLTALRVVSIASLRGVGGAFSFAPADQRRLGLVYAYRFRILNYADVQPLRSASQSLSIGIVERFGGVP